MPDHLGDDMRKVKVDDKEEKEDVIKGKVENREFCEISVKSSR